MKSKKKKQSSISNVEEQKDTDNTQLNSYENQNDHDNLKNFKQNQLEDDNAINGKQCLVCIEEIKEECVLNPCLHSYCYPCIVNWMKQRQNCPLCNSIVTEIIRCDQSIDSEKVITQVSDIADMAVIEKIKSNSQIEQLQTEKFECLDHSYLKNEVDKLLYKLKFVQTKMQQNSQKYDDFQWFISEQIDDQIYELEIIIEEFRKFSPSEVASRCFLLEEHLDAIRNNKWDLIEDYYSDIYAIELQEEEEQAHSYQYGSSKTKNQNNKKSNKNQNCDKNKQQSLNNKNKDYDDDYYISNYNDDADYSIKNVKPKAPKKKFNTTIPSHSQMKV